MQHLGRILIIAGGVLVLLGLFLTFGPRLPFRIGRLPLDLRYESDNFGIYFPLGTSIVISIILTIIVRLLTKR